MQRNFPVVLIPQPEGGYFVQCPSLPGCHSQGETVDESLSNIREAIELTLEDMEANGEAIPESGDSILAQVQVAG